MKIMNNEYDYNHSKLHYIANLKNPVNHNNLNFFFLSYVTKCLKNYTKIVCLVGKK